MIKFILNKVPRGVLQRLARWMMPVVRLYYTVGRGRRVGGRNADGGFGYAKNRGVECPLCGGRFRRFMPYGYVEVRRNALCPKCLALERHRLLWLWLTRETDLLRGGGGATTNGVITNGANGTKNGGTASHAHGSACAANGGAVSGGAANAAPKFLHIAPEVCLSERFERILPPENYITADLESPLARVKMDVQAIPFADGTFDVVFCNHVLEHVADDRRAMREVWRVVRPGGWGVLLSPVDEGRAETFEDDTVTDPAERTRLFGQYDHRRVYGRDYADRLREAGWRVEEIDYLSALTPAERAKYALRPETLYVVRK